MAEIEKVINRLEDSKKWLLKGGEFKKDTLENLFDEAIQTIRELQSKSEEVCEWKYPSLLFEEGNEVFEVECNKNPLKHKSIPNNFSFTDFKYCPYCGKKIKVVE